MRIKKHFILRNVGGKHLIIDPSTGAVDLTHVYHLNNTAAWLWRELLDSDFAMKDIADLLISKYALDEIQANQDAELFVQYLSDNNFLEQ